MREEISLSELSRTIKRYIIFIILMMAIGMGGSLAYMHYRVTPLYQSQSELIVSQVGDENIQYNQIQMNIQLIKTYESIITGSAVLNEASENLDGNISPSALRKVIQVSQPENSQLFYVQATMESPELAQQVLEEVITAFQEVTNRIYPNSQVQIVVLSEPSLNPSKVSPSRLVYTFVGLILGFAISVTYILVKELMDTRIRDERYLEKLKLLNIGNVYEMSNKDFKDPAFEEVLRIEEKVEKVEKEEKKVVRIDMTKKTDKEADNETAKEAEKKVDKVVIAQAVQNAVSDQSGTVVEREEGQANLEDIIEEVMAEELVGEEFVEDATEETGEDVTEESNSIDVISEEVAAKEVGKPRKKSEKKPVEKLEESGILQTKDDEGVKRDVEFQN